jgi:hypothetical protein
MDGGRGVDLHRHFLQPAGRLGAWGLHEPTQETFRWRSPAACTTMPGSDERASGQAGPPPLSHKTTTLVTCTLTHATAPACLPSICVCSGGRLPANCGLFTDFTAATSWTWKWNGGPTTFFRRPGRSCSFLAVRLPLHDALQPIFQSHERYPFSFSRVPWITRGTVHPERDRRVSAVSRRSMMLVQAVHHAWPVLHQR